MGVVGGKQICIDKVKFLSSSIMRKWLVMDLHQICGKSQTYMFSDIYEIYFVEQRDFEETVILQSI